MALNRSTGNHYMIYIGCLLRTDVITFSLARRWQLTFTDDGKISVVFWRHHSLIWISLWGQHLSSGLPRFGVSFFPDTIRHNLQKTSFRTTPCKVPKRNLLSRKNLAPTSPKPLFPHISHRPYKILTSHDPFLLIMRWSQASLSYITVFGISPHVIQQRASIQ